MCEIPVSPWWVHLVFINQDEFQGNKVNRMSFKIKAPECKVGWIITIPYFEFRGDDSAVQYADGNLKGFLVFMGTPGKLKGRMRCSEKDLQGDQPQKAQ